MPKNDKNEGSFNENESSSRQMYDSLDRVIDNVGEIDRVPERVKRKDRIKWQNSIMARNFLSIRFGYLYSVERI